MDIAEKLIRAKNDFDEVKEDALAEGIEQGKQAEQTAFWVTYTGLTGVGSDWRRKFANPSWKDEIFNPPFTKIKATLYADTMFNNSGIRDGLKKLTEIDVSETNVSISNMNSFANSAVSCRYYPIIKFPPNCDLNLSFGYNYALVKIAKIVVDETNKFTATFRDDTKLSEIEFEGTIGNNIDFGDCPLDAKSFVSVVEHLSATASGKTLTVKQSAIDNADWSTTKYASWDELKATKPNWGFAYK